MPLIASRIDDYLQMIGESAETEVMQRLRLRTRELPNCGMQISSDEGQFLAMMVTMLQARRTLEVGVFTGYSALWTASHLPADGKLVACDLSEEYTNIAKPFWQEAGVAGKIDLRIGPGAETLQALIDAGESGTYDFAFIDADKERYHIYFEHCLKLLRVGGVIALDNMFMGGRVVDEAKRHDPGPKAILALTEKLVADARVQCAMAPVRDGVMLAMKR